MPARLLIYQKLYDLALFLYPLINRLPKFHKQILGKHIEEICLACLLLVIKANKERGKVRLTLQKNISDQLDCLRILIRLSKDLRFISVKQYLASAERINEIGRMLSGWIKAGENAKALSSAAAIGIMGSTPEPLHSI